MVTPLSSCSGAPELEILTVPISVLSLLSAGRVLKDTSNRCPAPHPSPAKATRALLLAGPGRVIEEEVAALPIPPDTTDDELVALWLHGKSPNTIWAYGEDVAAFRTFTGKSLRATYLSDLQRYADSVVGAPATRARRLRPLKSPLFHRQL